MGDTRSSRYRNGDAMWRDGPHGIARVLLRRRGASLRVAEDGKTPPMGRIVLVIGLLVKSLMLEMIIRVVKTPSTPN